MATAITNLTGIERIRPISMHRSKQRSWRRLAAVVALLCAGASVRVAANPCVRRPVVHFIQFYEQTEDLGLWNRLVVSVLMTKASEPSSQLSSF